VSVMGYVGSSVCIDRLHVSCTFLSLGLDARVGPPPPPPGGGGGGARLAGDCHTLCYHCFISER
jgi:hypothetical protein